MVYTKKLLFPDTYRYLKCDLFGIGGIAQAASSGVAAGLNYDAQIKTNENNLQIAREVNETNLQQNRETNAANRKLAEKQNQWNIDQWNRENAYNSPSAQVQRYMDAGVNPIAAMSSGSIGSGNAANLQSASLATDVAPPPAVGATSQAPVLNPDMLGGALDTFLRSAALKNETKKTNVEVEKSASEIDKIKAETQAISDGNVRAEDLQPYALLEAQRNLTKLSADTALANATRQNIVTRSSAMLMSAQKEYSDILTAAIDAESKRFGTTVQARGLQLQAKEAQARIANMTLSQLIDYSEKFGVRRQWNKKYGSSYSSSEGNTAEIHGDASLSSPSFSKGVFDFSLGGSYGASESETVTNDNSRENGVSYIELRQDTLEPTQACFRLLREIMDNPADIRLGKAFENLSSYLSQTVKVAFANFMSLQKAIESYQPSIMNPEFSDSYR